MIDISSASVSEKVIRKSSRRVSRNGDIADWYAKLAWEENREKETLSNRSLAVRDCYRFWNVDHYKAQKVKDVVRITLCHDKFCLNCQNSIALRREEKYTPVLDDLRSRYDIYHVVFTVPNVPGNELTATVKKMYAKFPYLIQYLQGKRKAKDINFVRFGFVACIRALEVTQKETPSGTEFHPHFHCLFLFSKGLKKEKVNINEYSFSNGKLVRMFSDNEIFFQKVWHLLYNGERLTKSAMSDLKQGYSVIMDLPKEGRYHQVFKYVLGGNFKKGQPAFLYETFKTLYHSLYRRKMIQGYGILNRFEFDIDDEKENADEIYSAIVAQLKAVEKPTPELMQVNDVIKDYDDNSGIRYISNRSIRNEIKNRK